MDGLIPQVYKAIKKKTTSRHYECLSSSSSSAGRRNGETHHSRFNYAEKSATMMTCPSDKVSSHRRHNSLTDLSGTGNDWPGSTSPKKLVRFGSHRMFSCATGV
ncbi:hypothetical protein ACFE04_007833 [Oxalis oulophora]